MKWKRYDPSDMHRLLFARSSSQRLQDAAVSDDGYCASQALFCPYYETLTGTLGSDWGVILNPESTKFGLLVFEHDWCGCPATETAHGEWFADHGGGAQGDDEWAVPMSQRRIHRQMKAIRKRRAAEGSESVHG